MLGYLLVEIDASTFVGGVAYYRYIKGLIPKKIGELISSDPSTVREWEKRKYQLDN